MGDAIRTRRLAWRLIFVAIVTALAFLQLLPLRLGSGGLPGPDLFVLLCFVWVLRRPDYVPVWLVAGVMLLADFLFMRPPGLWAAATVLGVEFLRVREASYRDLPFAAEWTIVGVVLSLMTLGAALTLAIFVVPQPPLGLTLIQLILTIAAYPLVVLVSAFGLGLRRPAPGEVDELGHRL